MTLVITGILARDYLHTNSFYELAKIAGRCHSGGNFPSRRHSVKTHIQLAFNAAV